MAHDHTISVSMSPNEVMSMSMTSWVGVILSTTMSEYELIENPGDYNISGGKLGYCGEWQQVPH